MDEAMAQESSPIEQVPHPNAPPRGTFSIAGEDESNLPDTIIAKTHEGETPEVALESRLIETVTPTNPSRVNLLGPETTPTPQRLPTKAWPWNSIRRKLKCLPEPSPGWENAVRCLEDSQSDL